MDNSWRTKLKWHFPRSSSALLEGEIGGHGFCILTPSLTGNKRISGGLQLGHEDVRNPGQGSARLLVSTFANQGFTACSSGQQQSQSQPSKSRIDWENQCSGSDYKFFKTALSTITDGCGWLTGAGESNGPSSQAHLIWLCASFQDFSLESYFCKWTFFQVGF